MAGRDAAALSLRYQPVVPQSRARRQQRPIEYRDRHDRVWSVAEVAVLKVVSPAIDGPNLALVIRFEHMGEERFARWLGGGDWREPAALHRLFESVDEWPNAKPCGV